MRTLGRRALLAMPVALPVAAVAAQAEAATAAPVDPMVEAARKQMWQLMRAVDEQSARIKRLMAEIEQLQALYRKYPSRSELAATLGIAERA